MTGDIDMETRTIANYCKEVLDLANAKLGAEYYYNSLSICVIDAVFSSARLKGQTVNVRKGQ